MWLQQINPDEKGLSINYEKDFRIIVRGDGKGF